MTAPIPPSPGAKSTTIMWAVAAAVLLIALATVGGRLLKTNLLTVPSSPITLATDQNTYTAYRGSTVPVTLRVDGVSEDAPLLGFKLTLVDVPAYATLEQSFVQDVSGKDIGRIIVNKVNDAYILVAYDMEITQPGDLVRLNFRIANTELPRTSSRVRVFNEAGENALLVSEIATRSGSGSYLSRTITSGTAFTLVPTDATAPSPTAGSPTPVNGNGSGSVISPSPTYLPIPVGKDATEGPAYVVDGAGRNRLTVQGVKALGTDFSSVVAIQWSPVVTVKPVTYEVYRAQYKECGGTQDNCYLPTDFRKVAVVADASYAVDNTALPGRRYTYAVSNTIDGERSLLSSPSAPLVVGNDLGAFREAGRYCLPGNARDGIRFGRGTWASSDPTLLTVGSGSTLRPAAPGNARGGLVFVTSQENGQTLTNLVYVAPRGDVDCDGRVGPSDQNHVANGWTAR